MRKTILLLITVLFAGLASVNAQRTQVHLGLSLPQGKFADDESNYYQIWKYGKGAAVTGFNFGFKYYQNLSVENLSLVFSIDGFYNSIQSDIIEDIEEKSFSATVDVSSASKHINVPVTGGVNYTFPLNESLSLYGEGFLGFNTYYLTKFEIEYKDTSYENTYEPGFGLAYGLEGGLIFGAGNKYSIGLRYNNLGSYKLKYDYENDLIKGVSADGDDKFSKKLPISILSVTFGFFF